MLNKQDSVFWAYFNEYAKNTLNPIYKRVTIDLKNKVNEIFNVAYYGIFQYQMKKGEPLLSISPEIIQELSNYIIDNYFLLFKFSYQNKEAKSKFSVSNESDLLFIEETIEDIIIPFVNSNMFSNCRQFLKKDNAAFTLLANLAFKHEFDTNFTNDEDVKRIYHGLAYPLLITMLLVDVTKPDEMYNKVKRFFTFENVVRAIQVGRRLSEEEREYIKPDLEVMNNEEDYHSFIVNFQIENWEKMDLNTRYKYLFELSKFTALFLKDNIKSITAFGNGEEVLELIYNYLPNVIAADEEEGMTVAFNSLDIEKSNTTTFMLSYLNKDYDFYKTINHIVTIKEYKKMNWDADKLIGITNLTKYACTYLELVNKLKRGNGIIGDFLIENKKVGIVNTLKIYEETDSDGYVMKYKNIKFNDIELDIKNLEHLIQPSPRFVELVDTHSEISVMLRVISLVLALEPKAARDFGYAWQMLVKYYIIAFGPYKKQVPVYDKNSFKKIEAKVEKLLDQYEWLKQKDKVIDSLYLIYKLANFKN
ncbi:hypothetical protein [[Acholeplasma] multilocale]|uniref:hypothetical protein n=1 Tax=[Acholeplasma] multilocale TaxID=264638 RepID=UPI00047D3B8B|nr:hypothetical protein [[Acholeplasma] multilocale]